MIKFFEEFPEVLAVMSTRKDGNMKIGHSDGKSSNSNRKIFFQKAGIEGENVVSALLDHGNKVEVVNSYDSRNFIPGTDALVTMERGRSLSVTNADCYPVFFYDPVGKIIAITHAGWRGIVADIIPKVIGKMVAIGSKTADILVAVGPGICRDCFEFSRRDLDKLGKYADKRYFHKRNSRSVFINLKLIIQDQLVSRGVRVNQHSNLDGYDECTCCSCNSGKYFSARRDNKGDKKKPINAMVAIIGMKA